MKRRILNVALGLGGIAMIANEIRGLIFAAPVLYALYQSGGTLMAIWMAFCSIAGIALSVIIPMIAHRKLKARAAKQSVADRRQA